MSRTTPLLAPSTIALAVLLAAPATHAAEHISFKLCVNVATTYIDGGNGSYEDNWTSDADDVLRYARGMRVRVYSGSTTYYGASGVSGAGYLSDGLTAPNDGAGCRTISAPANKSVSLKLWSDGRIQNNDVRAWNDEDWSDPYTGATTSSLTTTFTTPAVGGLTKTVNVTPYAYNAAFNVYMAKAFAIYRHAGGMTGKRYTAVVTNTFPCDMGSAYSSKNAPGWDCEPYDGVPDVPPNTMYISALNHSKLKFVIVHELGHHISDYIVGDPDGGTYKLLGQSALEFHTDERCNANGLLAPPIGDNDGTDTSLAKQHSLDSWEDSADALQEGFGHFFAADVWNSHNETSCWFKYYKWINAVTPDDYRWVDCEDGDSQPEFPTAYMESIPCSTFTARGTELDWLRALWGLHTNAAGAGCSGYVPHFNDIADWFNDADDWSPAPPTNEPSTWTDLTSEAYARGYPFGCVWVANAVRHGVNH